MNDDGNRIREWFTFFSSGTRNKCPLLPHSTIPAALHSRRPENHAHLLAIGGLTLLCSRSKCLMIQNSLFPITSAIQSSLYAHSRAESVSLLNPLVILETGSWTSPPANETGNQFSPLPKSWEKKKKIFQLGEVFFKYTKYFSSFLALGKSINVPWKCWKLPGKTSQLLIKRKSHQL